MNSDLSQIALFLTDVDGCLTDGAMYYSAEGETMKRFCVYDGMGMVLLQKEGIPCGILTSENTDIVASRAKKLQLQYLYQGVGSKVNEGKCQTKLQAAEEICKELGITLQQVCFVGDDINDISLLSAVGFAACPQTARPEVMDLPGIQVVPVDGGQGVIRWLADAILRERQERV